MLGFRKVKYRVMAVSLPISSLLAFDVYLSWIFRLTNMSEGTQEANQLPVIRLNRYTEPEASVMAHVEDSSIKPTISAKVQT